VWNPFNGACLGTFPTKHAKTITSLCLLDVPHDEDDGGAESGRRKRHILTGGLDGLLRIHSATGEDIASGALPFVHGMRLADPISALALSSDMSRLAVGTTTGIVTVYQRRRSAAALAASRAKADAEERREPRHGTYSYFTRGAHERPRDPDDYLLPHEKKRRLAEYDVLLRKFRYGDALDAALAKRQPQAVSLPCMLCLAFGLLWIVCVHAMYEGN
jgi:U3 small nucleolar RNA-associated protein 15